MQEPDVKIYQKNEEGSAREQMSEIFDLINFHRSNGNFEKARELGRILSTLSPAGDDGLAIDAETHFTHAPTQGVLFQLKVLLTYAAEYVVQTDINPEFLSIMVINTMHDEISNKHPNFFKSMSDGAAFTFYSLAMRRSGNVDDNIGEAFAMLCEEACDDRQSYINLGKSMWRIAREKVRAEIENIHFVK